MSKKQTIKRTPLSKQVETVCKEGVAGNFTSDLPAEFLQYIGAILTNWTHTEYAMVLIFRELLNVDLLISLAKPPALLG